MVNSVVICGIVVTSVLVHDTKSGSYISFRIKNDNKKNGGKFVEVLYARVNVFSEFQQKLCLEKGLDQGDRVWIYGELMARKEDRLGRDILEIRAIQVDKVHFNENMEVYDD